MEWLIPVAIFIGAGLVALASMRRRSHPKYLAIAEYWVYLPHEELPAQDAIMERMVRENPFGKGREAPIGPGEGLLFSDVRLHIGLALRRKNPHIFRPDLFDEHIEPTPEILSALADAKAVAKVRYASEERLKDHRHLQFLPHAAEALATKGDALVIYDVWGERLMTIADLRQTLENRVNVDDPDLHLNIVWRKTIHGGKAETRGLVKVGLPEIATGEMESDQKVIAQTVLAEAGKQLWNQSAIPESMKVDAYGDSFQLNFSPKMKNPAQVTILRMQPA